MWSKWGKKLTQRLASVATALLLLGLQAAVPVRVAAWNIRECDDWAQTHSFNSDDWPQDCKGSLKVNKKVDADGNNVFEGSNGTAKNLGFKWGYDNNTPARDMGTTASNIPTGIHTVNENNLDGFAFVGWYYTNDEDHSCTHPVGMTLPLSVAIKKNQTTEITLCNQVIKGSITIVKDAVPNSTRDFFFTTSGSDLSNFALDDDASVPGGSNTLSNSKTFNNLVASDYTVNETQVDGWSLKSLVCSDGASVDKTDNGVTVHLTAGQKVTCTFTNQKKGHVYVTKVTDPTDTTTDFSLSISGDGNITGPTTKNIVGGQTINWEVGQGTYSVNEALTDGWNTTNNTCEDLDVTTSNLSVYCTTTNTKKPSKITGRKFNDVNGNGQKDEGEPYLKGWKITLYSCQHNEKEVDSFSSNSLLPKNVLESINQCNNKLTDTLTNHNGSYTFDNLLNGKYKVCEAQKDFWTQTYPSNADGCHMVTIDEPGQVITADFGNHHNVSLDITKTNNKPNPVIAGDTVTYTVKVTVPKDSDTVHDATTVDVLPSGFGYVAGSWTANSSVRGNIKGAPTTEPTYGSGSEGVWQLGTMVSGETVTLTYQAKIAATVTPGTYANTVFAKGFDNRRCANNSEQINLEPVRFESQGRQQQCNEVVSPFASSKVTITAVLGETTFKPGQVLGATTMLVNTGATWQPLQLILPTLMILGTACLSIVSRRQMVREGVNR